MNSSKVILTQNKLKQFVNAWQFLNCHPAFVGQFERCLCVMPMICCKNGRSDGYDVKLYKDQHGFKKWFEKYKTNLDSLNSYSKDLEKEEWSFDDIDYIDIAYKDFYKCDWKEDHIEIWLEVSIARYMINTKKKTIFPQHLSLSDLWPLKYTSFEEAIISLADILRNKLGIFETYNPEFYSNIPKWIFEQNEKYKDTDLFQSNVFNNRVNLGEQDYNELWWNLFGEEHFPDFKSPEQIGMRNTPEYKWLGLDHLKDIKSFKQRPHMTYKYEGY
jgi:hypothetical protein